MGFGHGGMGQLVIFILGEHLIPGFAIVSLQLGFSFLELVCVHGADGGVHGMFGATAIHADDLELHIQRPLEEIGGRSRVPHQEAELFRLNTALRLGVVDVRLIPGITMVAGIDDQDVALLNRRLSP